ncbi:hypothetical protein [Plasmodium yoelii yoelii]|uniref:Uncharacterized protein n=1 Tax=Plasmodium yoelii yoelii TaxID=73239 RepID=Q7RF97_PLAYO|nr:hypothetical protein [Plasmodium yoelii yoelii]
MIMDIYIICIYFSTFPYTVFWGSGSTLVTSEGCSLANATFWVYPTRLKSTKAILIYPLLIFGFDK